MIYRLFDLRQKSVSLIGYMLFGACTLLTIRLKITQEYFFLFLIWNSILALFPFVISNYLKSLKNPSRKTFFFAFFPWLLFLPNTPYLITDYKHLVLSEGTLLWLDILMLFCFALLGFLVYSFSVMDMKELGRQFFPNRMVNVLFGSIPFLCAFGIYLGRFERFNSWNLITQPENLIREISNYFIYPQDHSFVWVFTIGFGLFLSVVHYIIKKYIA